jgi:hypothetical protein
MNAAPEEKLEWPPTAEDLRRLYLDERLSAAKIAARYGLKYASPKTAESTVLHHLKKHGISRRDKAELARKVTAEMEDAWVKRYEAGESLKQIAGNEFSPVTVFLHLRKRGVKLRDKVDALIKAVTKFRRAPFSGDNRERAYLLGFVWGDCSVERHGRAVRVRSGTTHPEFVNLFVSLFSSYGRIRTYPKLAKVTPAEWNLEVDLHGSFEFLLTKGMRRVPEILDDTHVALDFTAGFSDAEGCIYFHRKRYGVGFEFKIANKNVDLLRRIQEIFTIGGYHPKLQHQITRTDGPQGSVETEIWNLCFYRIQEVRRLLMVLPLRHEEKTTKARLALAYINSETALDDEGFPEGWKKYLTEIERECYAFIQDALHAISDKNTADSKSLLS